MCDFSLYICDVYEIEWEKNKEECGGIISFYDTIIVLFWFGVYIKKIF